MTNMALSTSVFAGPTNSHGTLTVTHEHLPEDKDTMTFRMVNISDVTKPTQFDDKGGLMRAEANATGAVASRGGV